MVHVPNFSPAPDPSDPASFNDRAGVFVAELVGAVPVMNAQRDEVNDMRDAAAAAAATATNAPGTQATSSTPLTIGTGSKSAAIQTGKAFGAGQWVTMTSAGAPANWMCGMISAHNPTTGALTVAVGYATGSGQFSDWIISISAPIRFAPATVAQLIAGVSDLVAATPASIFGAAAPVLLDDTPTVPLNMVAGVNFLLNAPTGNRTFGAPSGHRLGQSGLIITVQGATPRSFAWPSAFRFTGGAPAASAVPYAIDAISYFVLSNTVILAAASKGF